MAIVASVACVASGCSASGSGPGSGEFGTGSVFESTLLGLPPVESTPLESSTVEGPGGLDECQGPMPIGIAAQNRRYLVYFGGTGCNNGVGDGIGMTGWGGLTEFPTLHGTTPAVVQMAAPWSGVVTIAEGAMADLFSMNDQLSYSAPKAANGWTIDPPRGDGCRLLQVTFSDERFGVREKFVLLWDKTSDLDCADPYRST